MVSIARVTKAPEFDEVVSASLDHREASLDHRGEEPTGSRLDDWWMRRTPRTRSIVRWAAPAAVIAVAAATRLWNLGHPDSLVFDETYYVKDGWSLWNLGYESRWPAESDPRFAAGETDIYTGVASYVVHPPLGQVGDRRRHGRCSAGQPGRLAHQRRRRRHPARRCSRC